MIFFSPFLSEAAVQHVSRRDLFALSLSKHSAASCDESWFTGSCTLPGLCPQMVLELLLFSLCSCFLGTKSFTEEGLCSPAAIGTQHRQRAEMHRILNAEHENSASQLRVWCKLETQRDFALNFWKIQARLTILHTSCPSWRVWFILCALRNHNAHQAFILSHGILHNTWVEYLLRKR